MLPRHETSPPSGCTAQWLELLLAIPLTQVLYIGVLSWAMCVRMVEWRGVRYSIRGPWEIQLLEYRPYQPSGHVAQALDSL